MADYTHEYSNFPTTIYTLHNFLDLKDAPLNVASVVSDIKNLILQGSYNQAALKLEENKNILSQYLIDATFINTLDEELRNLEIYAKTKKQALYYTTEVPEGVSGDIWIG